MAIQMLVNRDFSNIYGEKYYKTCAKISRVVNKGITKIWHGGDL